MKKFYITLVACLALTAVIAQPAGWTFVQPISAINNTATQVIGYQLRLTVNTQTPIGAGQMLANGDDIRFGKDCAGNTLFNYWIESGINTAATVIWVKLDTLPASDTAKFYMYYGNSSAATVSAVAGTFIGPHSSTDSVASGGAGGATNSQRGFRFAPNEDILMTHVGKREPNGTVRTVTLFNFATQAIVTQQTVGGPAGQYSYNPLTTPVWLTSGTQYVLELYQGASDGYYFGTSSQIGQHLTYFDMRYCNSCTANTFPTSTLSNYQYGYPDMWYFTKLTVTVAPTIVFGSSGTLSVTNSGPATVCMNDSVAVSVSATGGVPPYTYSWLPVSGVGNPNSATTMISPSASGTYTCTIFDGCGSGAVDSVVITVNPLPTVTANVSNDSICPGSSFVPTGGGAVSYSWTGGLMDNFSFTPTVTDTYTVTGTDANGCSNTASVEVVIRNLPVVTAAASSSAVCAGDSVTLTGSGAATYSWDNSVTNGIAFVPSATMMYHVTGMDLFGCTNMDSISVTVNPLPVLATSSTGSPYCAGLGSASITISGASSYLWMPGSMTGSSNTVSPSTSTSYTITGTDTTTGCSDSAVVSVIVNQLPVLATSATGSPYCSGFGSASITISGANSYLWMPGSMTGSSNTVSPSTTTSYTITGTDTTTGCSDSVLVDVIVHPNPVLAMSGDTVCNGNCAQLNANATNGTPAYTYNWTPATGLNSTTTPNPVACNTVTMCYTATVTDANGCMDAQITCAVINQLPVVALSGPSTVCVTDGLYTLTGTPATGTFSGPGVTGQTFSPSSAGNGTHQVVYSYTDASGCTGMDSISIVVSPCVGITDNNSTDGIEVYPNPFGDELTLNISGKGTSHVRMFNSLGQVVLEQEMNEGRNEINTTNLEAGVYFMEVETAGVTSTIRVVKSN